MGFIFWLSLTDYSDSLCFLVAHPLLRQDGFQQGGFQEVVGHVTSPFDLSQILHVAGGLFVPCSLPRPPVI